jgi:hypothetical protein
MDAQIGFFMYTRCHALENSKYKRHMHRTIVYTQQSIKTLMCT